MDYGGLFYHDWHLTLKAETLILRGELAKCFLFECITCYNFVIFFKVDIVCDNCSCNFVFEKNLFFYFFFQLYMYKIIT